MSAYSKHAWVVFGLSLAAGTAHASIPDSNGVIHGCYNVLSGSTRIVEGTNCGLFERSISWQQTGPEGPAGQSVTGVSLDVGDANCPAGGIALTLAGTTSYICNGLQGPPGPQGPAGDANLVVGSGVLDVPVPQDPERLTHMVVDNQPVIAPSNGTCTLTVAGTQLEASPGLWFQPLVERDDGMLTYLYQRAAMVVTPGNSGHVFSMGATTDSINLQAGRTYKMGVALSTDPDPISGQYHVGFSVSWICKFEPVAN